MSFSENGFVDMGRILNQNDCAEALHQIRANRPWSSELFLTEAEFKFNPMMKGVNPCPGRNVLERIDTSFVEDNVAIREYLRAILGPVTVTLDKKAVAAVPTEWIPAWVMEEIKDRAVPNLGAYIKPQLRDITYFHGIDWHQDIIDYPERQADFITLYVYLDQVGPFDSPLYVLLKSHETGANVFPHNVRPVPHEDLYVYQRQFLEPRQLVGQAGSAYLWHACTLHGTAPTSGQMGNRISLRYVIAKQGPNGHLLDEVNKKIKGPLSLGRTRRDLDMDGKAVLRGNQLNDEGAVMDGGEYEA